MVKDDDTNSNKEKAKMYINLVNKLLHALEGMAPEKTHADIRDTLAKERRFVRKKGDFVLNEGRKFLVYMSFMIRLSHAKSKLHHIYFEQVLSILAKEKEEKRKKKYI